MLRPILTRWYLLALLLPCLLLVAPHAVRAQEQDGSTAAGIKLYQQGNFLEAAKVLEKVVEKNSTDADAWYYLGLSYYQAGEVGVARPAFEHFLQLKPNSADATAKLSYALILANEPEQALSTAARALELGDKSAEPHYAIAEASLRASDYETAIQQANATLKIDPRFFLAYVTRSFAHHRSNQEAEAAVDLEQLLALHPDDPDAALWQAQIEQLRAVLVKGDGPGLPGSPVKAQPDATAPDPNNVFTGKAVTTKARVTSKSEPRYTEPARKAGVMGTVLLRCVFGADGKVRDIFVLKPLAFGLTSQAVDVARKIKFIPAQKDGSAVSMYIHLEYNFNLY